MTERDLDQLLALERNYRTSDLAACKKHSYSHVGKLCYRMGPSSLECLPVDQEAQQTSDRSMLRKVARILLGSAVCHQRLAVCHIRQRLACMCYQGRGIVVKLETVGLNTVDLDTVGLDTVGLGTVGLSTVGQDTVDLKSVDLKSVDLKSVDLKSVDLKSLDLKSVHLDTVGLNNVTLPDIVWLNTVAQDIGPVLGCSDSCSRNVLLYRPVHVDLSSLSLTNDICGGHLGKCWGRLAQDGHHVAGTVAGEEAIVYVCAEHDAYPFLIGDVVVLAPLLCCLFLLPKVFPLPAGSEAGLEAWR